jgi:hypothetical protein
MFGTALDWAFHPVVTCALAGSPVSTRAHLIALASQLRVCVSGSIHQCRAWGACIENPSR